MKESGVAVNGGFVEQELLLACIVHETIGWALALFHSLLAEHAGPRSRKYTLF